MDGWRKFLCVGGVSAILFLSAALFCGCVSKSKAQAQAQAQAQAAYLAGQNAALRQQPAQEQTPGVTVVGPVQNPDVPWVEGLTLAQAIATANYLDAQAPEEIIITRQGESATLSPDVLINGAEVPLQPGDVIEIRP